MKKWFILILILLMLSSFSYALEDFGSKDVKVYVFYGQGCPHCSRVLSFLERQIELHPNLELEKYETYFNQENRELFEKFAMSFNYKIQGVPTLFIGDKIIVGDNMGEIGDELVRCSNEGCVDSLSLIDGNSGGFTKTLTIPAVIGAAAVDAINPCAFAVLILLLSTILVSKSKRRALYAGFAFSLAIFISYFLMGLGLYSAISISGLANIIFLVVAILAILIGLFNLKDYLWYGRWFKFEVPDSWRPRMRFIIKHVSSIHGAFLIGFIISLFLLPCTSGPYIVILGLLSKVATKNYAFWLLVIYNLVFILPMVLITLAIYFGITTTAKAEQWRQRSLKRLHLIAGLIILLLGIGMLIALGWGLL